MYSVVNYVINLIGSDSIYCTKISIKSLHYFFFFFIEKITNNNSSMVN